MQTLDDRIGKENGERMPGIQHVSGPIARTLGELALLLDGRLDGPADLTIERLAPLDQAGSGDICFADDDRLADTVTSNASAFVFSESAPPMSRPVIRVANPRLAFIRLLQLFSPAEPAESADPAGSGIHPSAVVHATARIGIGVRIGPHAVVEAGVVIGDRTVLEAGVTIGHGTSIGSDCRLYPRVTIYPRSGLGDRVIIQAGTVVGSDGFGYVWDGEQHQKVPHIGTVVIEDDVEIGAGTTIDRGTIGETRIGSGTKIDNLVQIGHNVRIGKHCLLVAMSGLAGSTVLEDRVTMAAKSGAAGHIRIGRGSVLMGGAGAVKDVPAGAVVSGVPARPHRDQLKTEAVKNQLPELLKRLKDMERRLRQAEASISPTAHPAISRDLA